MKDYRKKTIMFLLGLMVVFFLVFAFSLSNLYRSLGTINIMPQEYENPAIMLLSLAGIIKCVHEVWAIEHRKKR